MSTTDFVEHAKRHAHTDPVVVSVRELLEKWGRRGRGYRVVADIRAELARADLATSPDFNTGHIDNLVRLVPLVRGSGQPPSTTTTEAVDGADEMPNQAVEQGDDDGQYLRVDSLRCSANPISSIAPDRPVEAAMTEMALNDYSQLAVMSGKRSLRGFISWESIGRARLTGEIETVQQATVTDPVLVGISDPLLRILPAIASAGFVFIVGTDKSVTGIVTAADVTDEFGSLAEPFFLLGEIERRLRYWLRGANLAPEEYAAVRSGQESTREVIAPEQLTLGEIERLLQDRQHWQRIKWSIDQHTFMHRLSEVREVRNALMHFSRDLPSADEISALRNFAHLLSQVPRRP